MNLQTAQQWASLIALIIGIGNAAWIWLSRPARDTNKRIDQVDERINTLNGEVNDRADRHREELKAHDRRIQRVEDDLRHLPTKDDIGKISHAVTAVPILAPSSTICAMRARTRFFSTKEAIISAVAVELCRATVAMKPAKKERNGPRVPSASPERSLTPKARVVGMATAGLLPRIMGFGPAPAVKKVLAKTGLSLGQMDVIELNEAFAAQGLAVLRDLGLADDEARVNPNGGAIAMGHPLGMSGARLVTTAMYELHRRGGRYALCTMCIGVGQGLAMIIERV